MITQKSIHIFLWILFMLASLSRNLWADSPSEIYDLRMTQGAALLSQKRYAEAEAAFRLAINARPQDVNAIYFLGMTEGKQGKWREAEDDLTFVLGLTPQPIGAYLDLALVYYEQKKYKEALGILLQGTEADPDNAMLYYYQGTIYQELGEHERAAPRFLRAVATAASDTDLILIARYKAGISFFRKKIINEAKDEFLEVVENAPDSEMGHSARRFLVEIDKMEARQRWQALNVGYQYDDNVILESSDAAITAPGTIKKDSRYIVYFNSDFPVIFPWPWGGAVGYTFYQSLHQQLQVFNTTSHQPSLSLTYEKDKRQTRIDYLFGAITLNGDPYLTSHTLRSRVSILRPTSLTRVGYKFQQKVFADSALSNPGRTGANHEIGANTTVYFSGRKGNLRIGYAFDFEDAREDQVDYQGHRLMAGVGYLFPYVRIELDTDYNQRQYMHANALSTATPQEARADGIYAANITLLYAYSKGVDLSLQYTHTRSDSNIAPFNYQRNVYAFNAIGRF